MNLRVGFLKPNRLWPLSDRNEVEQMNKITQTKKRAAILAGAQRVFVREGFEGASMDAVAREAKVAKPTLYNHFRDKNALYVAVVEHSLTRVRSEIVPPELRDMTATEGLKVITTRLARMFGRDDDVLRLCRICIGGFDRFPLATSTFMYKGPQRGNREVASMIALWAGRGELACDDHELAAQQLSELCRVGIFDPRLYGSREKASIDECHRIAAAAYQTFMARYGK